MQSQKSKKVYQITAEQCRAMIKGVCPRCGGAPGPVETEDNAGNPTFWAVCCSAFTWGVEPEVQKIAALMVDDGYVHYGYRIMAHPGSDHLSKGEDYAAYYVREQISGACSIVYDVLACQKKVREADGEEAPP